MIKTNSIAILSLAAAWLASTPAAHATVTSLAGTSGTWLAIAPNGQGDQQGIGINSAGLAFQTANVGWNNSVAYNTSAWTPYAPFSGGSGWVPPNGSINPFYLRDDFFIGSAPSGTFSITVDDDSQVYLNGALVLNDQDGNFNGTFNVNLTPFLVTGENLLAVKVFNAQGGFFAAVAGSVNSTAAAVPEPASIAALGLGLTAIAGLRRRRTTTAR